MTHDDLKNINEKLAFRKYLNKLDFETIQMLERHHRARENMETIVTRQPDLVSFRDPSVETHNVTTGRSDGVATSIDDKDRI